MSKVCAQEGCDVVLAFDRHTLCYLHEQDATPPEERPRCEQGHVCDALGATHRWICTECMAYGVGAALRGEGEG